MKLKHPKTDLYLLVIILFLGSLLLWLDDFSSSFKEGLVLGAVQVLVTVFVIDGLLTLDRNRRLSAVNYGHSSNLSSVIAVWLVKIVHEFDYKVKPDDLTVVSFENAELRDFIDHFLSSSSYRNYLKFLRSADKDAIKTAENLEKTLSDASKSISDSLKKVSPHPDPKIMKNLSDAQPSMIATFRMIKFIAEIVNEKIPELTKKNSDDETNDVTRDLMKEEMRRLISNNDGADDRASFNQMFKHLIGVILDIHESAEKNKLYFDA